ncbi:MAG: hypothetical protein K8W52_35450 [Deltaproteobacteria bacterium]|nr:hypothetical protein [Deltaproteobacteria bacterium]
MKRFALIAVVVAACGGKSKAPETAPADPAAHAEHHEEGGEPALPPGLVSFHEKLSQLWHAAPGPQRATDTCGETELMAQQLDHVNEGGLPAGLDEAAWNEHLTALQAAWTQLQEDCEQHDQENFEAKFSAAHDAFHALIALLPAASK